MRTSRGIFTTSDGVRLSYREAGVGPPLVMIPGWSQTAEQFRYQLEGLASKHRLIAVDMRGHGESDKPRFGYKVHRLSKDLAELLIGLELRDVCLMGHSMGCAVIWGYWELFGPERLRSLILVDESPTITSNPAWSEAELRSAGATQSAQSVVELRNEIAGPDGDAFTRRFVRAMVTRECPIDVVEWIIDCNLKFPRTYAAALLQNNCSQDWRDLIPRINLPTLVVGGRVSGTPWQSQVWISQQIAGARLELFEEDEGGSHFMFIENSAKFNLIVESFLAGCS